jgi:gluconolactonase
MTVEFREIASGFGGAEGPIALPDGSVLMVETLAGSVTQVWPDGQRHVVATPGGGPNGLAFGPDSRVYMCNNGGLDEDDIAWISSAGEETYDRPTKPFAGRIEVLDMANGTVELLYDRVDGEHLIAPNDLVFDADGGFWFTDFGSLYHRGPQPGYLHYATSDGSRIERVAGPLHRANGVGLSPDGSELYVAETMSNRVWAWEVIAPGRLRTGDGEASGARLVCELAGAGWDSLAVEADGHVCVAATVGGYIGRITPSDGSVERMPIEIAPRPTNICFGGPDRRTAFVTVMGGQGHLLAGAWPGAGAPLHFHDI